MQELSEEGQRIVSQAAARHGVSEDAVLSLLHSLAAGGGSQAQFSHPELGGFGQWQQGGMIMIGDMFNHGLKARVADLCTELSAALGAGSPWRPVLHQTQSQSSGASLFVAGGAGAGWPAELGAPSSSGAQNDLAYAYFPATQRLAIRRGGELKLYDAGPHQISGVSQQQSGDQSLTFTSQLGVVRIADLRPVPGAGPASPVPPAAASEPLQAAKPSAAPEPREAAKPSATPEPRESAKPVAPPEPREAPRPAVTQSDDIFAKLERLAELRQKGVITEEEFSRKKAELLDRL